MLFTHFLGFEIGLGKTSQLALFYSINYFTI